MKEPPAHIFRVGFTGTQAGLNVRQFSAITHSIVELVTHPRYAEHNFEFRHGMCEGADEGFHWLVREFMPEGRYKIIGLPGIDNYGRYPKRADVLCDIVEVQRPYLIRNKLIVQQSDELWAAPKGLNEEQRSGTWSTIRYTTKKIPPLPMKIFYPDGMVGD